MGSPNDCPIHPTYTGVQTNTYTFTMPVSVFSIDFRGFDGIAYCPRIEIKINDIFYPLTTSNISDFPVGSICTHGSFSNVALTTDGYITTSGGPGNLAEGRITVSAGSVSSVTISTNDGSGSTFSDPFNCTNVVPLNLLSFTGNQFHDCITILNWKTGIEFNLENIEVQSSADGELFNKIGNVSPKGINSTYSFTAENSSCSYFRLKINDLDGNHKYSEVIHIKSTCNRNICQIIPNPADDFIEIVGLKSNNQVSVVDMAGRRVLYFDAPVNNKLNVQSLPAGIYFIQVINKSIQIAILKVIKM